MAIFGVQNPKFFIAGDPVYGDTYIVFEDAYDYSLEPKGTFRTKESEIDAQRETFLQGVRFIFKFKINMYKQFDPSTFYFYVNYFRGNRGLLWLHQDYEYLRDVNGSPAYFTLKDVVPFYLEEKDLRDGLQLIFESEKSVPLQIPSSVTYLLIDGNSDRITDDTPDRIAAGSL